MRNIRETLGRIGLPMVVVAMMISMLGLFAGPSANAQSGYPYPPPQDQVASISGRLVDSVSGNPVAFIPVSLYRCIPECFFVSSQFVGSDGLFRFYAAPFNTPLFPGNYSIVVQTELYERYEGPQFAAAILENVTLDDIPLVSLPRIGGITGRFVDSVTGQPVSTGFYPGIVTLYRCTAANECFQSLGSQYFFGGSSEFNFGTQYGYPAIGAGDFVIEFVADRYETLRTEPFSVGNGEFKNLGTIAVTSLPIIGSISGQLIDAVTGGPLPGTSDPGARVTLFYCGRFGCYQAVAGQYTDANGRFQFVSDFYGNALLAGNYVISAAADQYVSRDAYNADPFQVGANANRDLGKIKLRPFPVRFSDIQGCNSIPASGGRCRYSVRITSGVATTTKMAAWSIVSAGAYPAPGTGGQSVFQTGSPINLSMKPGESSILRFDFKVPAKVQAGTYICTSAYVSGDPDVRLLNTIGQRSLFCITKNSDTGPFRLLTDQERRDVERGNRGPRHSAR
jgi:5-hydroxyisourate hydrolase-like protein (transthyretin family)